MKIYDGPLKYYEMTNGILRHSNNTKEVVVSAQSIYYTSLVTLDIISYSSDTVQEKLWVLYFMKEQIDIVRTDHNKTIRIQSTQSFPLQTLFEFNTGSGTFYTISFRVRSFSGWSEGGCKYGGYMILQSKQTATGQRMIPYGPYCNISLSNYPLVGQKGLANLTFGNESVALLFYAYSPHYSIDLDVLVHETLCEGIINPIVLCQDEGKLKREGESSFDIGTNYDMRCRKQTILSREIIFIRIIVKKSCIAIQQIFTPKIGDNYIIQILGTDAMFIQYTNPYVYNEAVHSFPVDSIDIFIGFSNLEKISLVFVKSTSWHHIITQF